MEQSIEQDFALVKSLFGQGNWVAASRQIRGILDRDPCHSGALHAMGLLAQRAGNLELAIGLQTKAAQFGPTDAKPLIALGSVLMLSERLAEAEAVWRRVIEQLPGSAVGWSNLGDVLRLQSKMDQAIEAYESAIAVDSTYAPAFSNLGNAWKDLGKIELAISSMRRAVELDPASVQAYSNLVYAVNFSDAYDAAGILDCARQWAKQFEVRAEKPAWVGVRDRRLKIGYLSADFRDHVVGRNVLPVLENHDRKEFEVHAFSSVGRHDGCTGDFVRAVDHWHECAALDDVMLANKIRGLEIDVLVDLSLHMSGNRLRTFALGAAPIQVTWAGYPGTTGMDSIDYRVTDPFIDPPGTDAFYSEKSVRLLDSFWCYRPHRAAPEVNELPAKRRECVTFGCLNQPAKMTDRALQLWGQVLAKVADSRMIILLPESRRRVEIRDYFDSVGVRGERIGFVDFCKPMDHMLRYHELDISLDPMPYTGHTSTLDSLWMGVPVVTISGRTSVSRGSVTALSHVGLVDLIAGDASQYVMKAVELAGDLNRLSGLRMSLRERMGGSVLCDAKRFAKNLEQAYRWMVDEKGFSSSSD